MDKNHSFLEYLNQNKNLNKEDVLKLFKNKYLNYRKNWIKNAEDFYSGKVIDQNLTTSMH